MTAPTETASPKTARKGSTQGPRGLAAAQAARGGLNDGTHGSSEYARAWDEKQYRDLFERAVEGIFRTTASGRALSINLVGARMLGYDSSEEMLVAAIGDAGATWIDPARRAELVERVRTAGAVSDFEYEVHRRDGSTAWLSIHARAVWDPDVPELVDTARLPKAAASPLALGTLTFVAPNGGDALEASQVAQVLLVDPAEYVGIDSAEVVLD